MIKGEGGVTIKTDMSADDSAAKNAASIIVSTISTKVRDFFLEIDLFRG